MSIAKVVFAHLAAEAEGKLPVIVAGLTRAAFDAIASGKTHEVNMIDAAGFAHRLVLFGGETAEDVAKILDGLASRAGSATGESYIGEPPKPADPPATAEKAAE